MKILAGAYLLEGEVRGREVAILLAKAKRLYAHMP
jgi:hypothetical protein